MGQNVPGANTGWLAQETAKPLWKETLWYDHGSACLCSARRLSPLLTEAVSQRKYFSEQEHLGSPQPAASTSSLHERVVIPFRGLVSPAQSF